MVDAILESAETRLTRVCAPDWLGGSRENPTGCGASERPPLVKGSASVRAQSTADLFEIPAFFSIVRLVTTSPRSLTSSGQSAVVGLLRAAAAGAWRPAAIPWLSVVSWALLSVRWPRLRSLHWSRPWKKKTFKNCHSHCNGQ